MAADQTDGGTNHRSENTVKPTLFRPGRSTRLGSNTRSRLRPARRSLPRARGPPHPLLPGEERGVGAPPTPTLPLRLRSSPFRAEILTPSFYPKRKTDQPRCRRRPGCFALQEFLRNAALDEQGEVGGGPSRVSRSRTRDEHVTVRDNRMFSAVVSCVTRSE